MTLEDTKGLFDKIARTLQDKIPAGEEAKFTVAGDGENSRDKVFELVDSDLRVQAFTEAMALAPNEARACVRRIGQRVGVRDGMNTVIIAYFSHPFWKELFVKAKEGAIPEEASK